MADENDKQEGQEDKPRKGLMPLIMVAVGAMLGGAGTVLMTGGSAPVEHHEPEVVIGLFDHPDEMTFTFNPQTNRGHKTAMITFTFTYRCDKTLVLPPGDAPAAGGHGGGGGSGGGTAQALGPVPKLIKLNWKRAYSRCLTVLMRQDVDTLRSADGREHLKRLLIDELTASLFPAGEAEVDDILWKKFYVQA